jgi:hypothetical protein
MSAWAGFAIDPPDQLARAAGAVNSAVVSSC